MRAETDLLRDFFTGLQTINRPVELFMLLKNEAEFLSGFFHSYARDKDAIVLSRPHYYKTISKKFAHKGIVGRIPVSGITGEALEHLEVKLFRILELESTIHSAANGLHR